MGKDEPLFGSVHAGCGTSPRGQRKKEMNYDAEQNGQRWQKRWAKAVKKDMGQSWADKGLRKAVLEQAEFAE